MKRQNLSIKGDYICMVTFSQDLHITHRGSRSSVGSKVHFDCGGSEKVDIYSLLPEAIIFSLTD